jgi:hypothetical protein
MNLPVVIFSTVIRGVRRENQSHGNLYLLNLANGKYKQVFELQSNINLRGHGCERGLRGICFHDKEIYIGTYDKLLQLNNRFEIINSFQNHYLKNCHEICRQNNDIYISLTIGNIILKFNLDKKKFVKGWKVFTPHGPCGTFNPLIKNKTLSEDVRGHLNNVWATTDQVFFSGKNMKGVYSLEPNGMKFHAASPKGTHNIQVYEDHLLMNWTGKNKVCLMKHDGTLLKEWPVIKYKESTLRGNDNPHVARQRFARGLCTWDNYIIGGSAPATISVYQRNGSVIASFQVTNNVRNSVHGLEVWPYATPEYIL